MQRSRYGSIAGNIDAVGDIVERGAFAKSIAVFKSSSVAPRMLWQQNADMPIGSWTEFAEDENGLYLAGKMNLATSWGKGGGGSRRRRWVVDRIPGGQSAA